MSANQPSLYGTYPFAKGTSSSPVLYASGYIPQTINVALADIVSSSEVEVTKTTVALMDFLVLKEWTSIRLLKQVTWVNPTTNSNIFDSLYGKYKYGAVLFGGLKPLASWSKGPSRQPSVWTNANGHKYNS